MSDFLNSPFLWVVISLLLISVGLQLALRKHATTQPSLIKERVVNLLATNGIYVPLNINIITAVSIGVSHKLLYTYQPHPDTLFVAIISTDTVLGSLKL